MDGSLSLSLSVYVCVSEPFFMEVAGRLSDATRELTEKAQQQQQNQVRSPDLHTTLIY